MLEAGITSTLISPAIVKSSVSDMIRYFRPPFIDPASFPFEDLQEFQKGGLGPHALTKAAEAHSDLEISC